jgi:hypothetical protein
VPERPSSNKTSDCAQKPSSDSDAGQKQISVVVSSRVSVPSEGSSQTSPAAKNRVSAPARASNSRKSLGEVASNLEGSSSDSSKNSGADVRRSESGNSAFASVKLVSVQACEKSRLPGRRKEISRNAYAVRRRTWQKRKMPEMSSRKNCGNAGSAA